MGTSIGRGKKKKKGSMSPSPPKRRETRPYLKEKVNIKRDADREAILPKNEKTRKKGKHIDCLERRGTRRKGTSLWGTVGGGKGGSREIASITANGENR